MTNSQEYQKNYMRNYRRRKPQKIAEINRRYWEKKIAMYHEQENSQGINGDKTE